MLRSQIISTVRQYVKPLGRLQPAMNTIGSSMSNANTNVSLELRRCFSSLPTHMVVPMPALSPTMEMGTIAKWNMQAGDKFEVGASICEVETDKATVSFDATDDGYIAKILVESGEIEVGQPIMITVEEKEDVAAFANYQLANDSPSPVATPATATAPAATAVPSTAPTTAPSSSSSSSNNGTRIGDRVFASPLARRMARESGLSLAEVASKVSGSGERGRLVAADVLKAAAMPRDAVDAAILTPAAAAATMTASAAGAVPLSSTTGTTSATTSTLPSTGYGGVYTDFQLSDAARTIAARQAYAMQTMPHYYLSVELNLTKLLQVRADFNNNNSRGPAGGQDLSVLDFIVKASALAMKQVPDVNAAWMETFVRQYEQVDINVVMGAGDFVATPVLRDVNALGLAAVSTELASFEDTLFADDDTEGAGALDSNKLALGTFSIHNLGMYGVKSAAPIVLYPQACALALGSVVDTVIPTAATDSTEGQDWEVAPIMTATLSCDHRVVDGAVGAQWLAAFKTLVENPMSMLL